MAEANGEEKLGLLSNGTEITTRELTSGLPEPRERREDGGTVRSGKLKTEYQVKGD